MNPTSKPERAIVESASHLSQISTRTGLTPDELILRYQKAIQRFLCKRLGNEAAANEVLSVLMEKMLKGSFSS